ncbi:hypothetical protein QJS66_13505 [Kocuria rhizophila]|nr:hypothetical protein QJS66_13505 [Kocuria rhizophila]
MSRRAKAIAAFGPGVTALETLQIGRTPGVVAAESAEDALDSVGAACSAATGSGNASRPPVCWRQERRSSSRSCPRIVTRSRSASPSAPHPSRAR